MKINQKLFLLLLTLIVVLVLLCSLTILSLLERQTEKEKLNMSDESVRQMLLSFEYVTDDIKRYVFDRCRSEEIAGYLTREGNYGATANSVRVKIDAIIRNSPYLTDGVIVSRDGQLYHSGFPGNVEKFKRLQQSSLFMTDKDIAWLRDEEGELYLRRNIYQVFPYEAVGFSVFLIDQEQLRAMVGMDHFSVGQSCIINSFGDVILMTENTTENQALFQHLLQIIRKGETLPRAQTYQGDEYRVIAVNRDAGAWSALYAVRIDEYLGSFFTMRRFIWFFSALLTVVSAFASYWISFVFTKNLRILKNHVNLLDQHTTAQRIPDIGHDEVGELAKDFNVLLERLDLLYQNMLKESADKQQTKYMLLELKYRALQAQVSPHFLCNILSAISLLAISGEAQQVERLAIDASQYLRNNLRSNEHMYQTVAEEIRMVREYVHLVRSISAVPICLRVHDEPAVKKTLIPNMLLQPLVENSLKHGIPPQTKRTFLIDITVCLHNEENLCITISDNGIGYQKAVLEELRALLENQDYEPKRVGFGTAGVIRRLSLKYGKEFRFEVGNGEKSGAITRIILPAKNDE